MFDQLVALYRENVVETFAEYRDIAGNGVAGKSRDLRAALASATALFHFREHLPAGLDLSRSQVEALCPDYGLVGDISNASKHGELTGKTPHGAPLVTKAAELVEVIRQIEYEDSEGRYFYNQKDVVVKNASGTSRSLLAVLTNVLNFWESYLHSKGLLPQARVFEHDCDMRYRTRAECDKCPLTLTIVPGHRFSQSMQLLKFNAATGLAEPVDLTGATGKLTVYAKPPPTVDLSLTHDATGKQVQSTITLTEAQGAELGTLGTEEQKQRYLHALPVAKEAFRRMHAELQQAGDE